jgi:hypothetical protein
MASQMYEKLCAGKKAADAESARLMYINRASRFPSSPVRIATAKNGTRMLIATADIPADTVITTYPPDIIVYKLDNGSCVACDTRPEDTCLDEAGVAYAVKHMSIPVRGFQPLVSIVSDPSAPGITPANSGPLVSDVVDENPYSAVFGISHPSGGAPGGAPDGAPGGAPDDHPMWDDDTIPAIAQATRALVARIAVESNVRIACNPGDVVVLMSVRAIRAGEKLITGRRPLYWMGDDVAMAEAVYSHIVREHGDKNHDLREHIGLPPK